jgi:hypothetical protein
MVFYFKKELFQRMKLNDCLEFPIFLYFKIFLVDSIYKIQIA